MPEDSLRANQEAFDAALPDLLNEHTGKTAVFHGAQLWGLYDDLQDAHADALEKFGSEGVFLVARIKPSQAEPVSLAYDIGLMFGEI